MPSRKCEYSTTINIVLPKTDKKILQKVCKMRGQNLSVFVRRLVFEELVRLGYMKSKKKALGILP